MIGPSSSSNIVPKPAGFEASRRPAQALHVFVLYGFAVAQPLLDVLGRGGQFFIVHDARPVHILALALAVCFLPPTLIVGVELAVSLVAPVSGRAIHRILVALLVAATFLPPLNALDSLPGSLRVIVALSLGAAGAWAYVRSTTLRAYLSILGPAPVVFVLVFLFLSPAGSLVRTWLREPWQTPSTWSSSQTASQAVRPSSWPGVPVVLVVFDELSLPTLMDRSHRIDALRYPNFAALADTSHWFRSATTTADTTVPALTALLTGRYRTNNEQGTVATATKIPENLFTLFAGAYSMNVFEPVTQLCPPDVCPEKTHEIPPRTRLQALVSDLWLIYLHCLLPSDLSNALPPIDEQWARFAGASDVTVKRESDQIYADEMVVEVPGSSRRSNRPQAMRRDRVLAQHSADVSGFLAGIRAHGATDSGNSTGGSSLHFLHCGLPHSPWRYLPSGHHYGTKEDRLIDGDKGFRNGRWVDDHLPVIQGLQRYLLQLGFVDRLLGNMLRTLEESGLYDRALVVVTADHGLSFQPGGFRRRADNQNFADIMAVPLFIKLPNQHRGTLTDRNVELIDILPTIVEVLGLPAPWPMDGVSVFDFDTAPRTEKRLFGGRERRWLTIHPAAMDAQYETVERIAEIFGSSSDPWDLYRIGPFPELVGRSLMELEHTDGAQHRVRLRKPGAYDQVDPASGFVPARVVGVLRSEELRQGPLDLAIAIGGSVVATTQTLKRGATRASFSAMVPEQVLKAGRNRVEVFVISNAADRPTLQPTGPL